MLSGSSTKHPLPAFTPFFLVVSANHFVVSRLVPSNSSSNEQVQGVPSALTGVGSSPQTGGGGGGHRRVLRPAVVLVVPVLVVPVLVVPVLVMAGPVVMPGRGGGGKRRGQPDRNGDDQGEEDERAAAGEHGEPCR